MINVRRSMLDIEQIVRQERKKKKEKKGERKFLRIIFLQYKKLALNRKFLFFKKKKRFK